MRFAILGALALMISGCVSAAAPEARFVKPDDCFNPAKQSRPDYVNACGNSP